MKSLFSLPTLQSILDHFGAGTIVYVTNFEDIGLDTWRHFIDTDTGEFEMNLAGLRALRFIM